MYLLNIEMEKSATAFSISEMIFFRLWLIQGFIEDWTIGKTRGRMMGWAVLGWGTGSARGASSVSYRQNFLAFYIENVVISAYRQGRSNRVVSH